MISLIVIYMCIVCNIISTHTKVHDVVSRHVGLFKSELFFKLLVRMINMQIKILSCVIHACLCTVCDI